jgi:hypothetical protein
MANVEAIVPNQPDDSFQLSELVRCYTTQLDGLHKMWNYLLGVSAAAVTLAWSKDTNVPWFIAILTLGFIGYAITNLNEIYKQQKVFNDLQIAVNRERKSSIRLDYLFTTGYFETTPANEIWWAHVASDACVVVAILSRIVAHYIMELSAATSCS